MMLTTLEGVEFEAFEFGPDDAQSAVMLLHDWWGVLDYNREWAERLAGLGYRTLVVDLYDGEQAHTASEAGEMMRAVDQDTADTKLLAALEHLRQGGRRVATLGWSFGGRQAMQAALLEPETVAAVVLFYCRMVTDVEALGELGGPVLSLYAENEQTWPAKMEKFNAAMAEAGREVESYSYLAAHGFANPAGERYSAEASADAWKRVQAFLLRALPPLVPAG